MYKFYYENGNKCPKYVNFNGTILRYLTSEKRYWCDNGDWGINYYWDSNQLKSKRDEHFNKSVELHSATETEWLQSVGYYVPDGYRLEDGSIWTEERYEAGEFNDYDDSEIDVVELWEDDYGDKKITVEINRDSNGNYGTRVIDNEMMYLLIR